MASDDSITGQVKTTLQGAVAGWRKIQSEGAECAVCPVRARSTPAPLNSRHETWLVSGTPLRDVLGMARSQVNEGLAVAEVRSFPRRRPFADPFHAHHVDPPPYLSRRSYRRGDAACPSSRSSHSTLRPPPSLPSSRETNLKQANATIDATTKEADALARPWQAGASGDRCARVAVTHGSPSLNRRSARRGARTAHLGLTTMSPHRARDAVSARRRRARTELARVNDTRRKHPELVAGALTAPFALYGAAFGERSLATHHHHERTLRRTPPPSSSGTRDPLDWLTRGRASCVRPPRPRALGQDQAAAQVGRLLLGESMRSRAFGSWITCCRRRVVVLNTSLVCFSFVFSSNRRAISSRTSPPSSSSHDVSLDSARRALSSGSSGTKISSSQSGEERRRGAARSRAPSNGDRRASLHASR